MQETGRRGRKSKDYIVKREYLEKYSFDEVVARISRIYLEIQRDEEYHNRP